MDAGHGQFFLALTLLLIASCHGATEEIEPFAITIDDSGVSQDLITPPSGRLEITPPREEFLGLSEDALLEAITLQPIKAASGTSGMSLSLRFDLEGEIDAAFKPKTLSGQRWNGEITAYRLSRLLGIHRVPPAASRRVRLPILRGLLEDDPAVLARFNTEGFMERDNTALGAVMYWVPTIRPAEVDRLEDLPQWTGWLRQGAAIPPERLSLARQLSNLIVFDYVIGNWDRWSGDNLLVGTDGELLIMDNNATFVIDPSPNIRERLEAPLRQVERFSVMIYRRLIGLDEASIRQELEEDPAADELLSNEQLQALLARRDQVIERIEELTEQHGHDEVLCFP